MGGGAFGLPLSDIETTGSTTFSAAAGFQVVVRSRRAAAEAIEKCSRRQRPTSRVNGQGFGDEASKINGRSGESMVQVLQVPSKLTSGAQRSAACTRERGDFSCLTVPRCSAGHKWDWHDLFSNCDGSAKCAVFNHSLPLFS